MTICCLRKRKLKKMLRSSNQQKLVDKAVDCFIDIMNKKFSRRDFKLRTSESRVKNLHFKISKNRSNLSLKQVHGLFECLNKVVDVAYQY